MPYTLDISIVLPNTETGITDWVAQLVNTAGANVGAAITTGFVEIGGGNYLWHYANFPDGHRGGVKFYRSSAPTVIRAFVAINPEEAENIDKKVSIGILDSSLAGHTAAGSVGRALQLARAETGGKWVLDTLNNTLTKYDVDNTTVIKVFNLTPANGPYTSRTPTAGE
jgi:hypothetical protein